MAPQAIIDAYLGNILFERVADYVRRGRPYAARPIAPLKAQWLSLARLAAEDGGSEGSRTEMHDLEAEVAIRGETMPERHVWDGRARRVWREHLERLRHPDRWGPLEHSVYGAALAFHELWRSTVKH